MLAKGQPAALLQQQPGDDAQQLFSDVGHVWSAFLYCNELAFQQLAFASVSQENEHN